MLFLLFMLLAGCSSLEYDKETLYLHSSVSLEKINVTMSQRERDSQLFVQVRGIPSSNQAVYYKIDWYDATGMKIPTALSQWKRVNLIEDIDFSWKMPAPTKGAVNYKVYITTDIGNGIIH